MENSVILSDRVNYFCILIPVLLPHLIVLKELSGKPNVADRCIKPHVQNLAVVGIRIKLWNIQVFLFNSFVYSFSRNIESPVLVSCNRTILSFLKVVKDLFLHVLRYRVFLLYPFPDLVLVLFEIQEEVVSIPELYIIVSAYLALWIDNLIRFNKFSTVVALVSTCKTSAVRTFSFDIPVRKESFIIFTVSHVLCFFVDQA